MKKIIYFISLLIIFLVNQCKVSAQSVKSIYPNRLGMQTYTYQKDMDQSVSKTLDKIKQLGIINIESDAAPEGLTPKAFRKLLDERNMKCISVGLEYEDLVKDPYTIIKNAKIVGAKYIMTAWIPHETGDSIFTFDIAKQAAEDFNRVGKIIKDSGLTFCYHTHGFEFVPYKNENLFDYIVQNTNHEYVSFEMDIMWVFHGEQDPAKLLLKYPNRWKLMHLKDLKKGVSLNLTGGTEHDNDVALGTGQLNVPSILEAAKKVGVQYYFIEDESSNYLKQVPQTINYLKVHKY